MSLLLLGDALLVCWGLCTLRICGEWRNHCKSALLPQCSPMTVDCDCYTVANPFQQIIRAATVCTVQVRGAFLGQLLYFPFSLGNAARIPSSVMTYFFHFQHMTNLSLLLFFVFALLMALHAPAFVTYSGSSVPVSSLVCVVICLGEGGALALHPCVLVALVGCEQP